MKRYIILILFLVTLLSCKTDDTDNEKIPDCIKSTIENILDSEPKTPHAKFVSYNYDNELVYWYDQGGTPEDRQDLVLNENCEIICTLGGIGAPLTDCVDWENEAQFIEIIWEDNR